MDSNLIVSAARSRMPQIWEKIKLMCLLRQPIDKLNSLVWLEGCLWLNEVKILTCHFPYSIKYVRDGTI